MSCADLSSHKYEKITYSTTKNIPLLVFIIVMQLHGAFNVKLPHFPKLPTLEHTVPNISPDPILAADVVMHKK